MPARRGFADYHALVRDAETKARRSSCGLMRTASYLEGMIVVAGRLASLEAECPRRCDGEKGLEIQRLPTGAGVVVVQEPEAVAADMLVASRARRRQHPNQSSHTGVERLAHEREPLLERKEVSRWSAGKAVATRRMVADMERSASQALAMSHQAGRAFACLRKASPASRPMIVGYSSAGISLGA